MKKKPFIFWALLLATLVAACQPEQLAAPSLTDEKVQMMLKDYIYFTKDGYTLQITDSELQNMGVPSTRVEKIQKELCKANVDLFKDLETMENGGLFTVFFPAERVVDDGIDPRITIKNSSQGSTLRSDYPGLNVLDHLTVRTTINGGSDIRRATIPQQTEKFQITAFTKCLFGIFTVRFHANGTQHIYRGMGISPVNETLICKYPAGSVVLFIVSTGCEASTTVFFIGPDKPSFNNTFER